MRRLALLCLLLFFLPLVKADGFLIVWIQRPNPEGYRVEVKGEGLSLDGVTNAEGICVFHLPEGTYQVFAGDRGKVVKVVDNEVSLVVFGYTVPFLGLEIRVGLSILMILVALMIVVGLLIRK